VSLGAVVKLLDIMWLEVTVSKWFSIVVLSSLFKNFHFFILHLNPLSCLFVSQRTAFSYVYIYDLKILILTLRIEEKKNFNWIVKKRKLKQKGASCQVAHMIVVLPLLCSGGWAYALKKSSHFHVLLYANTFHSTHKKRHFF